MQRLLIRVEPPSAYTPRSDPLEAVRKAPVNCGGCAISDREIADRTNSPEGTGLTAYFSTGFGPLSTCACGARGRRVGPSSALQSGFPEKPSTWNPREPDPPPAEPCPLRSK